MGDVSVVRTVGNLSLPLDVTGNIDIAGPYKDMFGVPTKQGRLKEVFEGQNIDDIIDRFSTFLRDSFTSQISLLKYDLLREEDFRNLCQRMEERTSQDYTPILYFEIDRTMIELYKGENKVAFYKHWIGKMLDSVSKTKIGLKEKFKELQQFFEENFERI